jgi:hypothetical protein
MRCQLSCWVVGGRYDHRNIKHNKTSHAHRTTNVPRLSGALKLEEPLPSLPTTSDVNRGVAINLEVRRGARPAPSGLIADWPPPAALSPSPAKGILASGAPSRALVSEMGGMAGKVQSDERRWASRCAYSSRIAQEPCTLANCKQFGCIKFGVHAPHSTCAWLPAYLGQRRALLRTMANPS